MSVTDGMLADVTSRIASPVFVGRAAELGRLNELVHLATEPGGEAVVRVITGPAGVGKSALATTWAHRAAGHFQSGQLYVIRCMT